ncbi:MAG: diaminopimelate epimerase [Bacteroidales bacterium]|nr:diaminopimelate epimerase [Bacteroidales bacterium]
MKLHFHKYHGAGNDFIIIDERVNNYLSSVERNQQIIADLCNRRFGIGADGLMLLRSHPEYDFRMVYYNSDGYEGSMCGNGGRCLAAFAFHNRITTKEKALFIASDGLHQAVINSDDGKSALVSLGMNDISEILKMGNDLFLDTGSPHLVRFVSDVEKMDVFNEGRKIRYSDVFKPGGTNVNFAEIVENSIHIRTYERGVENETLACGTGITATAIAAHFQGLLKNHVNEVKLIARGGKLNVSFTPHAASYSNIILTGPAVKVFSGEIEI